jgi:hypothetical protein
LRRSQGAACDAEGDDQQRQAIQGLPVHRASWKQPQLVASAQHLPAQSQLTVPSPLEQRPPLACTDWWLAIATPDPASRTASATRFITVLDIVFLLWLVRGVVQAVRKATAGDIEAARNAGSKAAAAATTQVAASAAAR